MKNILLFISFFIIGWQTIHADEHPVRERININRDWRYRENDPQGIDSTLHYTRMKPYLLPCANDFILFGKKHIRPKGSPGSEVAYVQPDFDDSNWRQLNLPHDWAIESPFNIDYDGAIGKLPYWGVRWYRKTIDLPREDSGKQIYLDIDGAMSYASVWCNGKYVGGWPYGYASFRLDLTPYLRAGERNVLAIRLDNPDNASRWYPGGGLYRNVWLVKTSPVHVSQWGTFVRNVKVTEKEAAMEMSVCMENHTGSDVGVVVKTDVYLQDKDGNIVGERVAGFLNENVIVRKKSRITTAARFSVRDPLLWDIDTPNCYVAVSSIIAGGKEVDKYETSFGIRNAEFTLENGFMLNGRKVPLKGVCMHHDLGALGSAFNVVAAERQLRIMKEMGANAIRTSHNPPAPELVALCDRMGFLMQLELADTWRKGKRKNDYSLLFDDWSEADMRSLVRHYRNHPSVIMWSIGNEVPDQSTDTGVEIAHKLTAYSHDEDPTRPTSYGCNRGDIAYREIVNHVDVFRQNYHIKAYGDFLKQNPTRRYHASETSSATSSRGEYFFPVNTRAADNRANFQLSSYDMKTVGWGCMPEDEFAVLEKYPSMSGEFVWTGFDYLGEPTPYNKDLTNLLNFSNPKDREKARKELDALGKIKPPSRSSYFGIVDLCGFNVHSIVEELSRQIEADVIRIEPAEKGLDYAANNYAIGSAQISAIRSNPGDAASYPPIDAVNISDEDWEKYNTIIIATPLWWSNMAAPMQTFLFNNSEKMAGKNIGLIVSSASSGISGVENDAKRLIAGGRFLSPSLWIRSYETSLSSGKIARWLEAIDYKSLTQQDMKDKIYLYVNGKTLTATLVDNSSTRALNDLLADGPVTVHMSDYGNMEKVGELPWSLPRNDGQTETGPGDIILYQGRNFVIYYDTNSWNFTRLGKIDNVTSGRDLKAVLGDGDVDVTISATLSSGIEYAHKDNAMPDKVYDIKGNCISVSGEDLHSLASGVYVINGQKKIIR